MAETTNDFYVYRHIRLDTMQPFYIGKGIRKRAFSKHNRNKHWLSIVNNIGYRVDIILDKLTTEESSQKEMEFIKLYGRRDLGTGILVNLTDGGEGSYNPSEEVRFRIGLGNRGKKFSEERRKQMSEITKKQAKRTHLIFSEEHKKNISKSRIGTTYNDDYKINMSKRLMGRKTSEETKAKISEKSKSKKFPNRKGVVAIKVIDTETGVIYKSIAQASIENNLNAGTLNRWLSGKRINPTTLRYV